MGDGVYYEYYPYHDGPGASSSLAPMLVLALLFIGMLLLFSWAAYVDSRTVRGVVTVQELQKGDVASAGVPVSQPIGAVLSPPWGRGAPVSGNDVRAAMMSSASVSGFFKTL